MKMLTRSDHGNISNVCDWLSSQGLIKRCLIRSHGGRPEVYYTITRKGITYLIRNSESPLEFWNSLMSVVYWRGDAWSFKDLLILLDTYLKSYLPYYVKQGYYSFQLDSFNLTCKLWFQKAILPFRKITPAQKILEVIASNPNITLSKLIQISGETIETVESVIKMYTAIPHKPVIVDIHGHHDGPFYNTGEWRFQIHRAVVQSNSANGTLTLSLSLFGVLMVLFLVMQHHGGGLPHGLMYAYELQDYFEIIAKNYTSKIPLIFEKWLLLTSLLGPIACVNFTPILDKNLREESFRYSLRDGGNRELYLGTKETVYASQTRLIELRNAAMQAMFNFSPGLGYTNQSKMPVDRASIMDKTLPVSHVLLYLMSIIQPTDYDTRSFVSVYGENNYVGQKVAQEVSSLFGIEHLERNLAHEISFLYFLSLKIGRVFSHQPLVHYDDILAKLLCADKEISSFFNEQYTQIKKYYQEIYMEVRKI